MACLLVGPRSTFVLTPHGALTPRIPLLLGHHPDLLTHGKVPVPRHTGPTLRRLGLLPLVAAADISLMALMVPLNPPFCVALSRASLVETVVIPPPLDLLDLLVAPCELVPGNLSLSTRLQCLP